MTSGLRGTLAATALTALAVSACGNGTTGTLGGEPPPLSLVGLAAAGAEDTAARSAQYGSGWKLDTTLSDETPDPRPVFTLGGGQADGVAVARLADALGLGGEPQRSGAGWVVERKGAPALVVNDGAGQPWTYGGDSPVCAPAAAEGEVVGCAVEPDYPVSDDPDAPVSSDGDDPVSRDGDAQTSEPNPGGGAGGSTGSAGSGTGSSAGEEAQPDTADAVDTNAEKPASAATAREAAAPVLAALGLTDPVLTVTPDVYATVQATPQVDGNVVSGYTTYISVVRSGRIVSAGGWLGAAEEGPAYPLISAKRAFALLEKQPRSLAAISCPANARCVGPSSTITGATLGLSLHHDAEGRALLVPSWLFDVKRSTEPVAQVAVEPRYLSTPTPEPPVDDPASIEPVPPVKDPPTAPDPAAPEARPSSYTTEDGGRTLVVEYAIGVCPEATYVAQAKETPDAVHVVISATDVQPQDPDTACIELAKIEHAKVELEKPLGDRTVFDVDGNEVARA